MTTVTRITLTEDQLTLIEGAKNDGWSAVVVAAYTELGVDMLDPTPFDPRSIAIPAEQWTRIGQAVVDSDRLTDPLSAANHLLDWMNIGPSSFNPGDPE